MTAEVTTYYTTTAVADVTDTVIHAGEFEYEGIVPWYGPRYFDPPTFPDYGQSFLLRESKRGPEWERKEWPAVWKAAGQWAGVDHKRRPATPVVEYNGRGYVPLRRPNWTYRHLGRFVSGQRGDLFTQNVLRVPTTFPSDMPSWVPYMMPGDYVEGVPIPFRYWPGLRREFYRYLIQTTKRLKPQELGANLLRWRWFNPDVVLTPGVWWRLKEKGHSNASILNLRWKLIYEIVADYQAARGPRSRWRKRRKNGTWTRWRKRRDPDKDRTDRIKEHEWSYPKPILKPDGKRPPVGRTLKQPHAAKQAREWHARWLVWWAQEGYRILPRNAADGVISLATAGIKRAHTSQISYRRGLNSLSIMERADGSEVYALPERVKVDASWGTTPRAITRERQRMAGERAGRETVLDFSDPTAEEALKRLDGWQDDPELGNLDRCRAELDKLTARILTPRQRQAFYLAHVRGLPNDEVAALMGIRPDTARKAVLDARHKVEDATGVEHLPNRDRGRGVAA